MMSAPINARIDHEERDEQALSAIVGSKPNPKLSAGFRPLGEELEKIKAINERLLNHVEAAYSSLEVDDEEKEQQEDEDPPTLEQRVQQEDETPIHPEWKSKDLSSHQQLKNEVGSFVRLFCSAVGQFRSLLFFPALGDSQVHLCDSRRKKDVC